MYSLMSPSATLIASEPSPTTTHRHPIRVSSVSSTLLEIGLSSAISTTSPRSDCCTAGVGALGIIGAAADAGRDCTGDCARGSAVHCSPCAPCTPCTPCTPGAFISWLDIDDVRSRLGIEFRRTPSLSRWLDLNRSTAPNSDGRRVCPLMLLAGVDGCMLPRDGEEAIEDVEVEGDGGFVDELCCT